MVYKLLNVLRGDFAFPNVISQITVSNASFPRSVTVAFFAMKLTGEFWVTFHWLGAWQLCWQLHPWGVKTVNFYVNFTWLVFCVNYLCSNELIGNVDLLEFNETWPKCSSDARLLPRFKYFSCDIPFSNSSHKTFYAPTLKRIFYVANRNWLLLAHHFLSDIVHSVWMSAITQSLVIQFSKVIFAFKG